MTQPRPSFITASAVPPKQNGSWFAITALADKPAAEIRLRGYIGMASEGYDYWSGESYDTGGAGTVQEFEEALKALGPVDLINVYITSEGGNVTDGIAIHNILARQKARVVCTIDGYAFSIATVIAMAANELRIAANGLMMIHDAEFWAAGSDVKALQDAINSLQACNEAIATAYQSKAGGTLADWHLRMSETTWLTGRQAAELKLADTILDDVALTAYAPANKATLARQMPESIRALFDNASPPIATPTPSTTPMLKPRTPLFTAATDTPPAGGGAAPATPPAAAATPPAADPVVVPPPAPAAAPVADPVAAAVTAAMAPMLTQITALAAEVQHLKGLDAHGIPRTTAASAGPVGGAKADKPDLTALSPRERVKAALALRRS